MRDHTLTGLARRALEGGAERVSADPQVRQGGRPASTFEWDVAGVCETPVYVERWTRNHKLVHAGHRVGIDEFGREIWNVRGKRPSKFGRDKIEVRMIVPCRKCDACRRKRSAIWAAKAIAETGLSVRTWFGTLEFSPEERFRAVSRLRLRWKRRASGDFDALSKEQQGYALVSEIGFSATRYLKRLRKGGPVMVDGTYREFDPAKFRYLMVSELHKLCGECKKSGANAPCAHATWFPHLHVLLHEQGPPIVKRNLDGRWTHGFSQWRLVEDDAEAQRRRAWYVCKYIAKEAQARVRASLRYGQLT